MEDLELDGTAQDIGINAEHYVSRVLQNKGYSVRNTKHQAPFDILCNGKRVEVKVARCHSRLQWRVNIHRHGKLSEENVDAYIFVLDFRHLDKKKPLLLLRKAPIGSTAVSYTLDSLLTVHNKDIENWSVLS